MKTPLEEDFPKPIEVLTMQQTETTVRQLTFFLFSYSHIIQINCTSGFGLSTQTQ